MKEQETGKQLDSSQVQIAFEQEAESKTVWSAQKADETQAYRAGAYELLAALLRNTPDQATLDYISTLSEINTEADELAVSLSMLGLAASHCDVDAIDDEYHALFIGLGRGELVPYGSWYLTGFLMEKPLGILRDDLAMLGFQRNSDTSEPEDHIAALCEVMALMINDVQSDENLDPQQQFFDAHINPWADKFFKDMSEASSATFYRSVSRLGLAFIAFEKRYLSMRV